MDRIAIDRFNAKQRDVKARVVSELLPQPFIGNPETARLVLLALNPGVSEYDETDHRDPVFRNAMLLSLKHELQDYPFYPLNPVFAKTGAGRWWNAMLRPLKKRTKLSNSVLSQRLMVIEWFPYHSRTSGLRKESICPSQEYSFMLARTLLNKAGVVMVGMRSKEHWSPCDVAFRDVPYVSNKRRPFISEGNMEPHLFKNILNVLQD